MRKGVLILVVLLCSACLKTQEKLFTALDECKDLKQLDDPEDMRDKYDSCVMFTDEELKTDSVCTKKCRTYCTDREMTYEDTWIDFTGCHCYCRLKV